jgi:hypothetical protein
MKDTTYNGWTNYETWRVNLEIFDGFDFTEHGYDGLNKDDAYDLGQYLKEFAEMIVFSGHRYDERGRSDLMEDYARAFLQNVNWREIAGHLIADYAEQE